MKNVLIVVLVVAVASLAGFSLHQRSELARLRDQLAAAHHPAEPQNSADDPAAFAEKKAKLLQDTLSETVARQTEQVSQLEQSLAAAKTNDTGIGSVFRDPDMKEVIKSQQKLVIGPLIDKIYADMFQQLNLTPEQKGQLKELMQSKMLVGAQAGMALLDTSADSEKRAEVMKQIKTDTDSYDAQIKEFLGEDKYKEMQTYEKGVGDRVLLGQFHDQMAGTGMALSSAQEKQMLGAMQEERNAFNWTTNPERYQNPGDGNFAELFSQERINRLTEESAQYQQKVLERAKTILQPDQYPEFEKFQNNQRQIQISGLKMAAKMFGGK